MHLGVHMCELYDTSGGAEFTTFPPVELRLWQRPHSRGRVGAGSASFHFLLSYELLSRCIGGGAASRLGGHAKRALVFISLHGLKIIIRAVP